MLEVQALRTGYGRLEAVHDATLRVDAGETVALIGHNGAGKTTTMKSIMGLQPVWGGSVTFEDRPVTNAPSARNVASGLCFVPEDNFVFADLTVEENLALAAYTASAADAASRRGDVYDFLPVLADRRQQRAGTLSGGEKRMVSLGMALMSGPRLLLLDEPSLGLAPVLVERVMDLITELVREKRLSVLMVEQNVEQAVRVADRVYVMRAGEVILDETAEEMRARDQWWDLF